MKQWSIAAGLGETAVRDILEKNVSPRISTLEALASSVNLRVQDFFEDGSPVQTVRIVGCVSAGEGWLPFDDLQDDMPIHVPGADPIAVEVRGDSMVPVYRDREYICGSKIELGSGRRIVGRDCIVMTTDGRGFVKFVQRGSQRQRFNLRSYSPLVEDLEDVALAWAAPITSVFGRNRG